jgi:hypothetical protein
MPSSMCLHMRWTFLRASSPINLAVVRVTPWLHVVMSQDESGTA